MASAEFAVRPAGKAVCAPLTKPQVSASVLAAQSGVSSALTAINVSPPFESCSPPFAHAKALPEVVPCTPARVTPGNWHELAVYDKSLLLLDPTQFPLSSTIRNVTLMVSPGSIGSKSTSLKLSGPCPLMAVKAQLPGPRAARPTRAQPKASARLRSTILMLNESGKELYLWLWSEQNFAVHNRSGTHHSGDQSRQELSRQIIRLHWDKAWIERQVTTTAESSRQVDSAFVPV